LNQFIGQRIWLSQTDPSTGADEFTLSKTIILKSVRGIGKGEGILLRNI